MDLGSIVSRRRRADVTAIWTGASIIAGAARVPYVPMTENEIAVDINEAMLDQKSERLDAKPLNVVYTSAKMSNGGVVVTSTVVVKYKISFTL